MWELFLQKWNGVSVFHESHIMSNIQLYTNASSRLGMAATIRVTGFGTLGQSIFRDVKPFVSYTPLLSRLSFGVSPGHPNVSTFSATTSARFT